MPDVILGNTGLVSIAVGGSENTWGDKLDANFVIIDNLFDETTGHDHSEDGQGAPIPTGGLRGGSMSAQGIVAAVGDGSFMLATAGDGIAISAGNAISVVFHALTAKTTPAGADELLIGDSAAAFALKRITRDNLMIGVLLAGTPYSYNAIGAGSGAQAMAANLYSVFSLTATGNVTLSITGAVAGKAYLVCLILTNGGAFTITDVTGSKWPGGARPSLSAAGTDLLFYLSVDGGTTWRCTAEIDSR